MPDNQTRDPTAGERDIEEITDNVEDLAQDLFDLTGDEIPEDLDVDDLDDLVAATPHEVDHAPYDEEEP